MVLCVYQSNTRGTVKDKANFKADEDVSALRKAIEGLGKIINDHYLSTHLSFTRAVQVEHVECKCCVVFSFVGTTEKTIIEVLTQRSNDQRQLIAKTYEKATGRVYTF